MTQEIIRATVPTNNKWHTEDIEKKAQELGMEKGEFILKAVDLFMGLDSIFYLKIKLKASQLHIPLWLYIQNKLVKEMAQQAAEIELGISKPEILSEFMMIREGEIERVLTGEELFNNLKDSYVANIKASEKY